jgi:hypothetical protein
MSPNTFARRCGLRGDRGSTIVLSIFLILVVLLLATTLIEAGNAMAARGHGLDIAQQAARAGADKLDVATLRSTGQVRIDPTAAHRAAAAYLAQMGETGSVTATPTEVAVTVTVTRPSISLGSISVRITASAAPLTG